MQQDYESFREAGGSVGVITMGTPEQVSIFQDRLKLSFPCFADPKRSAYAAFGIPQGSINQIAGPAVWARSTLALLRHGGGMPIGDPRQLHAAFVVDGGGVIRFAHYPHNSADLPQHADMVSTIGRLANREE